MADSGCDICPELLAEWGVKQIQMSFMFENAQFDDKNNIKGFYDCMRQGGIAKTAAINPDTFYNEFKSYFDLCLKNIIKIAEILINHLTSPTNSSLSVQWTCG
jgi:fatty acid-binding protein DegV